MKKEHILLALLLFIMGNVELFAQRLSVIEGQWKDAPSQDKVLNLYEIVDGKCQPLGSSDLMPDGRFAFAFYPPKAGYYAVGMHPGSRMYRYIFYFKPGDKVQFEIEGDDWRLTGNNTPENRAMEQWHRLVYPLESKAVYFMRKNVTFVEYFPLLEQMLPQVKAFPAAATPNEAFNCSFEDFKRYNFHDINLMFLSTPRSAHPTAVDYIDYFRTIDVTSLTISLTLLDYPDAMNLVESAVRSHVRSDSTLTDEQRQVKFEAVPDYLMGEGSPIKNDTLRGEMVLYYATMQRDLASMDVFRDSYARYLVTDSQKRRFNQLVGNIDDQTAGHMAIDFKFPDIDGKEVALSDFKGKVVYIDIWATWCGPCKAEIPHMTKLEEEFKDCADMAFLSVSIDKESARQKWADMVREKQMKGIQLFAGDRAADIAGPYKVKGIPRFILVGKDGRIISSDAPRPSSSAIRPLLKKALSAK